MIVLLTLSTAKLGKIHPGARIENGVLSPQIFHFNHCGAPVIRLVGASSAG